MRVTAAALVASSILAPLIVGTALPAPAVPALAPAAVAVPGPGAAAPAGSRELGGQFGVFIQPGWTIRSGQKSYDMPLRLLVKTFGQVPVEMDKVKASVDGGTWRNAKHGLTIRGYGKKKIRVKVTWYGRSKVKNLDVSSWTIRSVETDDDGPYYLIVGKDQYGNEWETYGVDLYDTDPNLPAGTPVDEQTVAGDWGWAYTADETTSGRTIVNFVYKNPPCMSNAEKRRIKMGMTRAQVRDIVGSNGHTYSRNPSYITVTYEQCTEYGDVMIGYNVGGGVFSIIG